MTPELKAHIEEKKRIEEISLLTTQLISETNIMGSDKEVSQGILLGLMQSHPTLQQSFIRAFIMALGGYSKLKGDLRNQGAIDFAKQVTENDNHLPYV